MNSTYLWAVAAATYMALLGPAGFAEIGRRRAYYPAAGGREDAIVMRLEL